MVMLLFAIGTNIVKSKCNIKCDLFIYLFIFLLIYVLFYFKGAFYRMADIGYLIVHAHFLYFFSPLPHF